MREEEVRRCSTGSSSGSLLGPLLRLVFRPQVEGAENVPDEGAGDPRQQPPVLRRLAVHAADAAAAGDVRGQGGVLHHARASRAGSRRSSSPAPGRCPIDRSGGRRRRGRARRRPSGSSARASCSASTPRAPAPTTAGSTAARPAWPGWRSRPSVPVIPVAVVGTDVVAPPGKKFGRGHPAGGALRQAAGLLAATRAWRTTATSCARSPTRSCTRSCGSPARSTSTCTPRR